ncbi:hypothetical protein AX16_003423 [Volvariella volvacea WC 439]|nr:hypothetical protein AX16_003423 [Volvariella volvacea WC 439]
MSSSDSSRRPKLVLEEFIGTGISITPSELHPFFESFQTLYTRKLWHQLTQKLFEFFDHPLAQPYRVEVFDRFVRDFENRINQLRLVELAVKASRDIDNPQTQLEFLTSLLSRINTTRDQEAHVLLLASIAHAKLVFGDLDGTKNDMDAAWKVLDALEGVENSVNAAYYGVAADYYKAKAEYAPYYRNSLLYLACVDPATDMSPDERLVRAHDLAISAFLSDSIYNFGELLMHPILDAFDETPHVWIKRLLFTFNEGSIGKFEALAPLFPQETIAEETRLPIDEVEHLVMKALRCVYFAFAFLYSSGMNFESWIPGVPLLDKFLALMMQARFQLESPNERTVPVDASLLNVYFQEILPVSEDVPLAIFGDGGLRRTELKSLLHSTPSRLSLVQFISVIFTLPCFSSKEHSLLDFVANQSLHAA